MTGSLVAEAFDVIGLEGISVVTIVALVSVIAWSSRARRAGVVVSHGVATARATALTLLVLVLAGVASLNVDRLFELLEQAFAAAPDVLAWAQEFLGGLL